MQEKQCCFGCTQLIGGQSLCKTADEWLLKLETCPTTGKKLCRGQYIDSIRGTDPTCEECKRGSK